MTVRWSGDDWPPRDQPGVFWPIMLRVLAAGFFIAIPLWWWLG